MLVSIPDLLSKAELNWLRDQLAQGRFVDGKLSAGKHAARVKNNEEMAMRPEQADAILRLYMTAYGRNPAFRNAALPLKIGDPIFARYGVGKEYGAHIDDPVMGAGGPRFRCDVATTLFISDLDEYDGGELAVETPFGEQKVRLPAGSAVVYPASSLHRVMPVTGGERLVAVTWIQSMVKSAEQRALLNELANARDKLMETAADAESTKQVDRSYNNLVRMWAEI